MDGPGSRMCSIFAIKTCTVKWSLTRHFGVRPNIQIQMIFLEKRDVTAKRCTSLQFHGYHSWGCLKSLPKEHAKRPVEQVIRGQIVR